MSQKYILSAFFVLASLVLVSCRMAFALEPEEKLPAVGVTFKSNDAFLQNLYNEAEKAERGLEREFVPGMPVLTEGAQYAYFWLETQPMGGAMYAKRDLVRGRNLQLLFMQMQREDGRIPAAVASRAITVQRGWDKDQSKMAPGQVYVADPGVAAFFGQLQGFSLPSSALDVYYLAGANDRDYLERLYKTVEKYDAYLWRVRDSNKDGILELWCGFDNGEDRSVRNFDAPDYWPYDDPPTSERLASLLQKEQGRWWPTIGILHSQGQAKGRPALDGMFMPYQSMDVMAWSYEARRVLAEISVLLKNGKEQEWLARADEVQKKVIASLWDADRHACYDRDKNGKTMDILLHNNMRCMWYRLFTQQMAEEFLREHLMNPKEFWTPMPLVSIAVNDPMFANVSDNSWSGQPQGLTWQRAIRAFENYGHYAEVNLLGDILLKNVGKTCRFRQQFDPFTGKPDDVKHSKPNYGPTILAVLEYYSRMYGIQLQRDSVWWSAANVLDHDFETTQTWGNKSYQLQVKKGIMTARLNKKELFSCSPGARVVTDFQGKPIKLIGIEPVLCPVQLKVGEKTYQVDLEPNTVWKLDDSGKATLESRVPFYCPVQKEIETDVCIVGAGSGGCGAAIAAAREGARIVLVEKTKQLGGTGTNAMVSNWEGGPGCSIAKELFERMKKIGGAAVGRETKINLKAPYGNKMGCDEPYEISLTRAVQPKGGYRSVVYKPEAFDQVVREILAETGKAQILDQTVFQNVEVNKERSRIDSILVKDAEGKLLRIRAKVFIDSSGSVFVCRKLGCETHVGLEPKSAYQEPLAPEKEKLQLNALTRCYRIEPSKNPRKETVDPKDKTGFPKCAYMTGWADGVRMINMLPTLPGSDLINLGYDECMKRSEKVVRNHWNWLQQQPDFGGYELTQIAPMLGIREGHRVVTQYVLRQQDLDATWEKQSHTDMIAVADHPCDIHGEGGGLVHVKSAYGIPYRCLIPKSSYTNLLVACRGAGLSRIAAASCRLQRTIIQFGHAAGVAAAWAARDQKPVDQIDVPKLVKQMDARNRYPVKNGQLTNITKPAK